MSKLRTWTQNQLAQLQELVQSGNYTYPEIAEKMGRSRSECQQRAEYMGLKNPTYIKRRSKHKHLRKSVLKYYMNHSAKEVQEKFKLTPSEFKSCLTVAYKNPEWAHLRKDQRRKDLWSVQEIKTLLQYSGLKPRNWIGRKLKRGGVHSVKESLSRLKIKSKHLNGMPVGWVETLVGKDLEGFLKTKAGPNGGDGKDLFCFKIIPWVKLNQMIHDQKQINTEVQSAIRALSRFQAWVYGTKDVARITKMIQDNIYE